MKDYSGGDGPRLDLGGDLGGDTLTNGRVLGSGGGLPSLETTVVKKGGSFLAVVATVVALLALGLALWQSFAGPSPQPGPPPDPKLVLGGTAERVAKLEKDVQELMLAVPALEKKLDSITSGSGEKNELAGLAAQVSVLKLRLDKISRSMGGPAPVEPKAMVKAAIKEEPSARQASAPKPAAPKAAVAKPKGALEVIKHKVRRGDTLYAIAVKYRVTIPQLKKWNALGKGSRITPGQRILIYK